MKVQIKSKQEIEKKQQEVKEKLQKIGPIQLTDQQIRKFLKTYQLKNMTFKQMSQIYAKHALTPYFHNTLISSFITIFLPGFTNIYYTFRPNSIFANIMPFAMPVICFVQYFYVMNKDLQNFCFNNTQDSARMRQKYKILYAYSSQRKQLTNLIGQIQSEEFNSNKENKNMQSQKVL